LQTNLDINTVGICSLKNLKVVDKPDDEYRGTEIKISEERILIV
jgi:hypothetical protein